VIVMIVIGWAVALPVTVVLGLFCASKVLGRRARVAAATGAEATDMTVFARQFPTMRESASLAAVDATSQAASRPVGAGY
jgi:hypothetical protein